MKPRTAPLITWYGDDFTGSTDALEVLASHGLTAVLFLERPSESGLGKFRGPQAIGLAGSSRSQTPQWMSDHLPAAFHWLRSLGADLCHYKVCSTFDSSPSVGSIGRALEIGSEVFQAPVVPIIAGVPALNRFTAFGNLFASWGGEVYRIDRHPAMSCHPVTPMGEADLRVHLSRQTGMRIGLVALPEMLAHRAADRVRKEMERGAQAVLLDVVDDSSLLEAGNTIWNGMPGTAPFVVGSSGVEHALVACWRELGSLPPGVASAGVGVADRLLVLSGSCSSATSTQIRHAIQEGFHPVRIDPRTLGDSSEFAACLASAVDALRQSRDVVLYTSLDSEPDSRVMPGEQDPVEFNRELGAACGRLLRRCIEQSGVRRVVVAGGDTSSHAGAQLGLTALTYLAPLVTGAPLCRAWASDPAMDGLEVVFKGGQIGGPGFFVQCRDGRA